MRGLEVIKGEENMVACSLFYCIIFIMLLYHFYYLALRPSLASLLLTQADSTIDVAQ